MSGMNRFDAVGKCERTVGESTGTDQAGFPDMSPGVPLHVSGGVQSKDAYMDYRKLHYKNTIPDNRVLVFLTGFCVGMVFFYLTGGQNASAGSLLDREHLAFCPPVK